VLTLVAEANSPRGKHGRAGTVVSVVVSELVMVLLLTELVQASGDVHHLKLVARPLATSHKSLQFV